MQDPDDKKIEKLSAEYTDLIIEKKMTQEWLHKMYAIMSEVQIFQALPYRMN